MKVPKHRGKISGREALQSKKELARSQLQERKNRSDHEAWLRHAAQRQQGSCVERALDALTPATDLAVRSHLDEPRTVPAPGGVDWALPGAGRQERFLDARPFDRRIRGASGDPAPNPAALAATLALIAGRRRNRALLTLAHLLLLLSPRVAAAGRGLLLDRPPAPGPERDPGPAPWRGDLAPRPSTAPAPGPETKGTVTLLPGVVAVQGTPGDDHIVLAPDLVTGELHIQINNQTQRLPASSLWANSKIIVNGGDGDDNIDARNMTVPLLLSGGRGSDRIRGGRAADVIFGGSPLPPGDTGVDEIWPGDGDDVVTGGGVQSTIYGGGDGMKQFYSATELAPDGVVIHGTAAADQVELADARDGRVFVKMVSGDGAPTTRVLNAATLAGKPLRVRTYDQADRVIATTLSADLEVSGGRGDDLLVGGRGRTTLRGEDGNDVLIAGRGETTLQGGLGEDILITGPGGGRAEGGPDQDTLFDGERATLAGGTGFDEYRPAGGASLTVTADEMVPDWYPGSVVQAVQTETEAGRAYANSLADSDTPIPSSSVYRQYIARIRDGLEKLGLPTRPDGVKLYVFDAGDGNGHADAVVRTILDRDVGSAPGADVALLDSLDPRTGRVLPSAVPSELPGVLDSAERTLAAFVDNLRNAVEEVARELPRDPRSGALLADGTPRLINLSQGASIGRIVLEWGLAEQIRQQGLQQPPTAAYVELAALTELRTLQSLSSMPPDQQTQALAVTLAQLIAERVASDTSDQGLNGRRTALAATLDEVGKVGVSVFVAAGNDQAYGQQLGRDDYAAICFDGVPGLFRVGATALVDANVTSEIVTTFTSPDRNVTFSAPGQNVPVEFAEGARVGNRDGTSFASPAAVGWFAIAAMPQPGQPLKGPAFLAALVPRAVVPVASNRTGAGALDPVRLIALAHGVALPDATPETPAPGAPAPGSP